MYDYGCGLLLRFFSFLLLPKLFPPFGEYNTNASMDAGKNEEKEDEDPDYLDSFSNARVIIIPPSCFFFMAVCKCIYLSCVNQPNYTNELQASKGPK